PRCTMQCVRSPSWMTRCEPRSRLCRSRAPDSGVAASSVAWNIRMFFGSALVWPTLTGLPALAGPNRHGALNQTLLQVRNGYLALIRTLSACHLLKLLGHWTSVHWTAL